MGKAVARCSKKSIARECMCDVSIREYILRIIGRLVHKEVKMLCSDNVNSILKEDNPEVIKSFT